MTNLVYHVKSIFLACALALLAACATPHQTPSRAPEPDTAFTRFVQHSINDYRNHYQPEALQDLLPPLLLAGSLANTNADQWIRDSWQEDMRNKTSDKLARVFLHVGDAAHNRISVPIYSLTMLTSTYSGEESADSALATWGARSLRANILGGPQVLVLTYALGSHRPRTGDSNWDSMNDNDGVSGHSFYGAVPLLTAARMVEHDGWRYGLYALSVMPAFSRINDDQHYTSQAIMGWSLAWLATRTVAGRHEDAEEFSFTPLLLPDGGYAIFNWRFR